jgi:phytoene dehydrogenase-like protein
MARAFYDAVVVGSGPNGLTAAALIADAGYSVLVVEARPFIGGGCHSAELTLPGFLHDVCSAIHPMGAMSPVFRALQLERFGVAWLNPPAALAHPFDDGSAAVLVRSVDETARTLGDDGDAWRRLMAPFVPRTEALFGEILKPVRLPRHPLLMARFAATALQSCNRIVRGRFRTDRARALFAGCAAHSFLPLDAAGTASFGLVLALAAHAFAWPVAKGGSQAIANALTARVRAAGGEIATGREVRTLADLPSSRVVLLDVTPRQLERIAGEALPEGYRRRLRAFRYGPGAFKIDWALKEPIPWTSPECGRAATVHVGGSYDEIFASEAAPGQGRIADRPLVLVAQQSLFDPSRAPAGSHTGWAYCHVPNGSTEDCTSRIEQQIERFAPGFRDVILARHVLTTADIEANNANMIGGDVGGGSNDLRQFLFWPPQLDPYRMPNPRLFLCSSSTPPGGGVHGMCGYWAARSVLRALHREAAR